MNGRSNCIDSKNKDGSLYWIKHCNFRLAVINVCPVLVPSELLLSTHLPTSEGWTAELTVGMGFVVPRTGFEPTREDLTGFEVHYRNAKLNFSDLYFIDTKYGLFFSMGCV